VRLTLAGLVAIGFGAAVGFATWTYEMWSLPVACKPCMGSVCRLVLCVIDRPRLAAVATLIGLVAMSSAFLAGTRTVFRRRIRTPIAFDSRGIEKK